ncbi:MAG: amino acid permease [Chloroflexi bacterium]|jgi:amino acid transporter|nr:amino acid permease [Chloroflexota bacterium]
MSSGPPGGGQPSKDVQRLHELGYAQELRRGMRTFSNFAVSFTIISILSGCLTLFYFAMNVGGPAVMTLGWLVVGFFVLMVALGMAEVASSYPTAGGLYYWAAKLAPESGGNPAAWSWFVGWFNLVGQVAVTAGIDFGLAFFINAFLNLTVGLPTDPPYTIAIYGIVLVTHALLNTFGIRIVTILNDVSVWWHIVGVAAIVLVTVVLNQNDRTDLGTVFSTFVNNTGSGGDNPEWPGPIFFGIPLYVMLIGLLNAQYTLTGYDASAHMSEETHDAATSAPKGIIWSVIISVIFGFILLVSMNVGITPEAIFPAADGSGTMVNGYQHALDAAATLSNAGPPVQIWIDAVGQTGGLLILFLVIGAQFYCGMASVTANSRMIYAFARDGAIPGSDFWHRINHRTRTPTNSIWLAAIGAFILGLPYLYSPVAYAAVTSIAVIGLYVAYVAPVFLRLRAGKRFEAGPWTLGRWSKPVGILATLWVIFIFFLFMLPQFQPIDIQTFNYTPVVFLIVLGGAAIWYFASARKWFKGPKVQGTPEELAAIEADLEII